MAEETNGDATDSVTYPWIRTAALVGVGVGAVLLVGDAGVSLYRLHPQFLADHQWGMAGALIVIAFTALWLWNWWNDEEGEDEDDPEVSSGEELIKDDPLARRVLQWVNEQIDFYDRYGLLHANLYFWFKIPTLVAAALVPVFALATGNWTKWVTAGLGVLIAVLEGVQQVGRYHDNWVAGIATRDQLERERELFLAKAGVYAKPQDGQSSSSLFAERASVLMTQEQGQWLKSRQDVKQDAAAKA